MIQFIPNKQVVVPEYIYVLAGVESYFNDLVLSFVEKSGHILNQDTAHRILQTYNASALLTAANLIVLVPKDLTCAPIVTSPENKEEAIGFLSAMLFKERQDVIADYSGILIILDYQLMDFWMHLKTDGHGDHVFFEIKAQNR